MSEQLVTLMNQMESFAVLVLIGVIAQRTKLLDDTAIDKMAKISLDLLIPFMIFTTILTGGTRDDLLQMLPFVGAVCLIEVLALLLGFLSSKLLRLPQPTRNIHIGVATFGNSASVGCPLVIGLFPEKGALVAAVYLLIDLLFIYTITPVLCDPKSVGLKINWKVFLTPLSASLVLGFGLLLLNVKIPESVVWTTFQGVGGTFRYFATIYIGADIGRKGLKLLFRNKKVFSAVGIKLILLPFVGYFFIKALGILPQEQLTMLSVFMMAPTMMNIAIMARANGSDEDYGAAAIILTSILCIVTIPAMMWVLSHF